MHSAGLPNAAGWQPALPGKEPCRVDTIAALKELENEPNCLDSGFPVQGHILLILSRSGIYAECAVLVQPLLRFDMG